jgi:hypothetical protein
LLDQVGKHNTQTHTHIQWGWLLVGFSSQDLGNIGPSYDNQKQTTAAPTPGGLNGKLKTYQHTC